MVYFYVLQDHFEDHSDVPIGFHFSAYVFQFPFLSPYSGQLTNRLSVEEKETQLILLSAE